MIELYPQQQMCCPVHLCLGQEAVAAGVCAQLQKEDYVFSNHRNHGHLIAKGADINALFAELYGKVTGCSGGKGGSMHMISTENHIMGTSAIVAGGLPSAVGAALACKMQKKSFVAVVFFGDGAVDEGTFYESINFAAVFKLPVIFVCENNFYATNSPQKNRQVNLDIFKIAKFFMIPGVVVDGNDVVKVWERARELIAPARSGAGPALMEARTYRYCTHVGPETDVEKGLRDKEEFEIWKQKCPKIKLRGYLLQRGIATFSQLDRIDKKVDSEVQAAVDFALASDYPLAASLGKDVY